MSGEKIQLSFSYLGLLIPTLVSGSQRPPPIAHGVRDFLRFGGGGECAKVREQSHEQKMHGEAEEAEPD